MRRKLSICLIVFYLSATSSYIVNPGPGVIATKGAVWPKLLHENKTDDYFIIKPESFSFKTVGQTCDTLDEAMDRYVKIIQNTFRSSQNSEKSWLKDEHFLGYLDCVKVNLNNACEDVNFPIHPSYELYMMGITAEDKQIMSFSLWGVLRGLETFSQLVYPFNNALMINATMLADNPRFAHRGLMLDTSRHFIPVKHIKITLDAMSFNKMNVFHWHLTDDQSFPYQSKTFPQLSKEGAYKGSETYSQQDVQDVIEYARKRAIRVVPEFDTPGHTRSWGVAFPKLLTKCYDKNGTFTGQLGPINPTTNYTYSFLEKFFQEVSGVFSDKMIHMGGDEVGDECWLNNPDVVHFMKSNNMTTFKQLEKYYLDRLLGFIDSLDLSPIVWEEVFYSEVELLPGSVVQVWKSGWNNTLAQVTKTAKAILSSCYYLDHLSNGGDWEKFYKCDPWDFEGSDQQKQQIMGGEACMWSESVNEYNVISRVWPRASAVAEKLWSLPDADNLDHVARRLEEHTCRMINRGVGAQPPNGPGFCP